MNVNTSPPLTGLARRLVHDGILDEQVARTALQESRQQKSQFVAHIVERDLADSLRVAEAASDEFGTPLLDLAAFNMDAAPKNLVDARLVEKHHTHPAVPARQPPVPGRFRPHQPARAGRDQVPYRHQHRGHPGRRGRAFAGAGEVPEGGRRRLRRRLRQPGGDRPRGPQYRGRRRDPDRRGRRGQERGRRDADRALRAQGDAGRDPRRRLGHPLRALREDLPHPLPHRRHPARGLPAAGGAGARGSRRASR